MTFSRPYFRTILVSILLMGSVFAVSAHTVMSPADHTFLSATIQQPSASVSQNSTGAGSPQSTSSNTSKASEQSTSRESSSKAAVEATPTATPPTAATGTKQSEASSASTLTPSASDTSSQHKTSPSGQNSTDTTQSNDSKDTTTPPPAAEQQTTTAEKTGSATETESSTQSAETTSGKLQTVSSSKASAQMNIVPTDSTLTKKGKRAKTKALKKAVQPTSQTATQATKGFPSATPHKQFQVEGGVLKRLTPTTAEQILSKDTEIDTLNQPTLEPLSEEVALTEKADSSKLKKRHEKDTSSVRYSAIFRDTIPLSRMTAISLVAPGFSQLYNKQAWKIPILYGVTGGLTAMGFYQNNKYKAAKNEYNALVDRQATQEELDPAQCKMIRYNTARTLFFVGAVASYLYFLGDGVLNYNGPENSVKKATTLSTICPGAGQLYNKSYWKVPIVVGAFATMGYVIDWNARGYKRYRTAYNQVVNGQPDEFEGRYSADYLKNMKDNFRRNRDLCIILTGALYLLNIVDAHVDAHLKDYDISDDLSVRLEPAVFQNYASRNGYCGVGMSLKVTF